jgi:translocation and assembly module TamA
MAGSETTNIPYNVVLSGVADFTLRELIIKSSDLFQLKDSPPLTISELKQRATDDMGKALKALNIKGYYDTQVDYGINLSSHPVTVNLMVTPGPVYTLSEFTLSSTDPQNLIVQGIIVGLSRIGITLGQPADMDSIKASVKKIFEILGNSGYPFAKIHHEKAVVDHTKKSLSITLEVDPGELSYFGELQILKDSALDENFIKKRLQWQEGEVYSNEKVIQSVEALNNTNLFSFVKITHQPNPPSGPSKLINMSVEIISNNAKSIAWGVGHEGSLGLNTFLGWRGFNVFGSGDILSVEAALGKFKKALSLQYTVPDFLWVETDLTTRIDVHQLQWTAYKEVGGSFSTIFTTPLKGKLSGYGGIDFTLSDITPYGVGNEHAPVIVSLPIGLKFNNLDDIHHPTTGFDIKLALNPSAEIAPTRFFAQASLAQQVYYPLLDNKRLILSGWFNIGISPGVGSSNLPMNRRFYAGGQKSVRGYGEQMAGPLDAEGVPIGGKSMLTFGTELKYYLTEDLAAVGFFDIGTAYKNQYPDFAHRLFMGFGSGLRYNTSYGDLLFDVAVPTNRRPEDSKAQIYLSLDHNF